MSDPLLLRLEVDALLADYAACLDGGELERWAELFSDDCVYTIIPRENYERGLPLALMRCESKGMLRDRVQAIRRTSVDEPPAESTLDAEIALRDRVLEGGRRFEDLVTAVFGDRRGPTHASARHGWEEERRIGGKEDRRKGG